MSTLIRNLSTLCGLCILFDGAYGPRVNPLPPSTSHILLKTYAPNHSHRSSPSFELWLGPLLQGRLKRTCNPASSNNYRSEGQTRLRAGDPKEKVTLRLLHLKQISLLTSVSTSGNQLCWVKYLK